MIRNLITIFTDKMLLLQLQQVSPCIDSHIASMLTLDYY